MLQHLIKFLFEHFKFNVVLQYFAWLDINPFHASVVLCSHCWEMSGNIGIKCVKREDLLTY